MKYIVLNIVLLFALITNAQDYKRTQNWYFGDSAGLSFTTDPPTVLTDGVMNAGEGCSTISDTAGNLLFYTNGVTVWNKNHQVMENGNGLSGHISSTQSSVIIPWPSNDSLFYIFTTDAIGKPKGLQYSLVNTKVNNGLGKVITKNILLQSPVSEKLAATKHLNSKDYWVLARGFNNNNFYAYLITDSGLVNCPIVTAIGATAKELADAQGEIKFSEDGTKLAEAVYNLSYNRVDLFTFDKIRGKVLNEINITNITLPYSVEFSAEANYLYVTTRLNYVYQYDINSSNGNTIRNSQHQIYFPGNTLYNYHGIIQKGTDDKLYIALWDSNFVSIIHNPEKIGDSCNFALYGINLGKKSTFGLPNFISSYFYRPSLDFAYTTNCVNDSINFEAKGGTTYSWQIFRNKAILHSSTQSTTNFNFTDTDEYTIQLVSGTDTVAKTIYIEPKLSLGQDTILCNQNSYSFNIPQNHRCITWQDGADSMRYTIKQSGTYYVSAYNIRGCLVADTVKVNFATLAPPIISQNNDSLFTDSGNYTYKWYYNNASIVGNSHTLKITKNGNYRVEITNSNGCTNSSPNFLAKGLSIQILKTEDHFKIYPIPTQNKLFIVPITNVTITEITLVDAIGRAFHCPPATEIDLAALAKGIYYLEIIDTENIHYKSKIIIN